MTSDEDMKTFKTYTDHLESTDNQEVPGKVFVKDDIEQYNKNRDEQNVILACYYFLQL